MDKETKLWIKEDAQRGAQKVCDTGACLRSNGCADCELRKYHTKPTKAKHFTLRFWDAPDSDELFALCAQCENAEVKGNGDEYFLERKVGLCIHCPVSIVEDALGEAASEAAYTGCM